MTDTDLELLRRYARTRSEEAFATLVQRHLDLVYSAALRQVRSPQLAEEVAQSVFDDLARNVQKLRPDTVLTAWLYQVTRRTAIDVVRRESRRQLREQIATEMNATNAAVDNGTGFQPGWADIEPLLDEAMDTLEETDRSAVLLRYFENRSLREVGQTLGTSDDAAQKRVGRAVERLREFFSKRGVTVGTSGLAVVISANAVQTAPAGLALTISSVGALAGTAVSTSTSIAATKTIAMTTLQKTIVGATLAVAVGTGIYEAHRASNLRDRVQTLEQQQAPLAEQIELLRWQRDDATRQLAALRDENERLRQDTAAKNNFAFAVGEALASYLVANNGQLPGDILELKHYFKVTVDDATLQRYELPHTGKLSDFSDTEPLLLEKAPVDSGYDTLYKIGAFGFSYEGIGPYSGRGSGGFGTNITARIKIFANSGLS